MPSGQSAFFQKAGREYIKAYVQFFKFAEGEEEGHVHQLIMRKEITGK